MIEQTDRQMDRPVSVPIDNFGSPAWRVFYQVNCSLQRFTRLSHNTVSNLPYRHTLWDQKTAPFYFCNNFVKSLSIRIVIGTHIPE